jgi:protein-S-isoprenylcysteine O-methyltransferase Ste14
MVPIVMWAFGHARPSMFWAGVALFALGSALRWWAAGTLHKDQEVTTGGPYAVARHPLYVGSFLWQWATAS